MKKSLKRLAFLPAIFFRHGSFRPGSVQLPPHKHRVFINPDDERAFKKLVTDTARGRESQPMLFWRTHAEAYSDALLLDIGANYGECAFNPTYAETQRCIAVEANPTLRTYLDQTHAAHPSCSRIKIVSALVGDSLVDEVPFSYIPTWTGGGSACETDPSAEGMVTVNLAQMTLDAILDQLAVATDRTLIFKMDVEGYECKTFRGFTCLNQFATAVGIIEFDTAMIARSGEDAARFFTSLQRHFQVYKVHKREIGAMPVASFDDLSAAFSKKEFHCDLILATEPELLKGPWRTPS